jgi:flagellar assembly protein FliH
MSSDTFLAMSVPRLQDTDTARIEQQARARGHAAGYTAGLRAAQSDVDRRVAELREQHERALRAEQDKTAAAVAVIAAAARALENRTVPVLAESTATLVATAVELAEAILGYELQDEERSARAALARALDGAEPHEIHVVRLNPDDLALLGEGTRALAGVDLVADASLSRGDAVTEFPDGYLDARLSTALARAKAALIAENP